MANKIRIMITKEDKEFERQCEKNLSKSDFEVIFVEKDGSKILEQVYKYKPDMLLLDVFMQKIDALGVLAEMKKAGIRPMIHGFIISALVVVVALLVEIAMGVV